jgi:two-component system phosphate regulon sensor histidine kinase PhoR
MAEGLVILDLNGCVEVYNAPAECLLGLPAGSLRVGQPFPDTPVRAAVDEIVEQARTEPPRGFAERLVPLVSGRLLKLNAARLPSVSGAVAGLLLTLHDAREADRLDAMRRDLAANVSHEVRTPLAAIRACSATLLGGALGDPERARRFVEMIEQHAERLARLVDDLSRLSDLEQGRIDVQRREVAVGQAVRAAVDACLARAQASGVSIEASVDAVPTVHADRDLLEEALVRLIDNAVQFTLRGGRVVVSALSADDGAECDGGTTSGWVCLRVADSGVGIPAADVARLSERFYRVDKARSRERGGCGLGLALVKHIVRAHGATMHIESEVDRGTTVTLLWPVFSGSAEDRVAAQ